MSSPTTLPGECSLVSSHGPGARPGSRVQGKDGPKTLKSEAQFGVCAFSGQVLVSVNTYKPALGVPRTVTARIPSFDSPRGPGSKGITVYQPDDIRKPGLVQDHLKHTWSLMI